MVRECMVCFEDTAEVVQPCEHALCAGCAQTWFAHHELVCPLCRRAVTALPHVAPPGAHAVRIRLDEGSTHVGITIRTCSVGGVRVLWVDPDDCAHRAGIRRGDVITHLNGLRVDDHRTAARIIDRSTEVRADIACTVRRLTWWSFL